MNKVAEKAKSLLFEPGDTLSQRVVRILNLSPKPVRLKGGSQRFLPCTQALQLRG